MKGNLKIFDMFWVDFTDWTTLMCMQSTRALEQWYESDSTCNQIGVIRNKNYMCTQVLCNRAPWQERLMIFTGYLISNFTCWTIALISWCIFLNNSIFQPDICPLSYIDIMSCNIWMIIQSKTSNVTHKH